MKPSFVALAVCSLFWGVVAADEPPGVESDPVKRTKQLEYQVRQLQEENARLKALLAEHGIGGGKNYQSIVEILSQLPAELRNPKGWDKYNSAEVHKWLSEHPIGEPFETTLQIATVQIGKNPYDLGSTTKGWMLSVYPTGKDFKFQGSAITQRIGEGGALPFRLFGDSEFARNAERLKPGQRITIKGKIRSINLGREQMNRREVQIGLSDFDIKFPSP